MKKLPTYTEQFNKITEALRECELLLRMAYTELSMQNKNGIFTDTSLIIRINNAIEKAKAALSAPAPVSEERG